MEAMQKQIEESVSTLNQKLVGRVPRPERVAESSLLPVVEAPARCGGSGVPRRGSNRRRSLLP